jgi:multisubunit Na+/H+ antiporter MnhG subunit
MARDIMNVVLIIGALSINIAWWFKAKGSAYRRQILLGIVFALISIFSYTTGMSFDIPLSVLVFFIAAFVTFFFLIKAARAEYRTKHSSSD